MGLGRSETSRIEGIMDPKKCQDIELSPQRLVKVSRKVTKVELCRVQSLLREFEDIFAWKIEDTKGIHARYGEHHIDLLEGSILVR